MKSSIYFGFILLILFACASHKQASSAADNTNRDGSSIEKAIIVNTAEEEQSWIKEHYPDSNITAQSVIFEKRKPYDKVDVQLSDGAQTTVYFDISKFYKK